MATLKPELYTAIARAAEMRASGDNWIDVARKLNRSMSRITHWPRVYHEAWMACYRAAEAHLLAHAASEALFMLRSFIRGPDPKLNFRAAELLFKARQNDRAAELRVAAPLLPDSAADPRTAALVEHLDDLSDIELESLQALDPGENPKENTPAEAGPNATPPEGAANANPEENAR